MRNLDSDSKFSRDLHGLGMRNALRALEGSDDEESEDDADDATLSDDEEQEVKVKENRRSL
jgi:hypothetical protein